MAVRPPRLGRLAGLLLRRRRARPRVRLGRAARRFPARAGRHPQLLGALGRRLVLRDRPARLLQPALDLVLPPLPDPDLARNARSRRHRVLGGGDLDALAPRRPLLLLPDRGGPLRRAGRSRDDARTRLLSVRLLPQRGLHGVALPDAVERSDLGDSLPPEP